MEDIARLLVWQLGSCKGFHSDNDVFLNFKPTMSDFDRRLFSEVVNSQPDDSFRMFVPINSVVVCTFLVSSLCRNHRSRKLKLPLPFQACPAFPRPPKLSTTDKHFSHTTKSRSNLRPEQTQILEHFTFNKTQKPWPPLALPHSFHQFVRLPQSI